MLIVADTCNCHFIVFSNPYIIKNVILSPYYIIWLNDENVIVYITYQDL